VREFLSQHQIPFIEKNIRQDPQARDELLQLTGKLVVPAFKVDEEWLFGYDPQRLESLISHHRFA
jgi:hypothetical protein